MRQAKTRSVRAMGRGLMAENWRGYGDFVVNWKQNRAVLVTRTRSLTGTWTSRSG
jgi:hypothetical protein